MRAEIPDSLRPHAVRVLVALATRKLGHRLYQGECPGCQLDRSTIRVVIQKAQEVYG